MKLGKFEDAQAAAKVIAQANLFSKGRWHAVGKGAFLLISQNLLDLYVVQLWTKLKTRPIRSLKELAVQQSNLWQQPLTLYSAQLCSAVRCYASEHVGAKTQPRQ